MYLHVYLIKRERREGGREEGGRERERDRERQRDRDRDRERGGERRDNYFTCIVHYCILVGSCVFSVCLSMEMCLSN